MSTFSSKENFVNTFKVAVAETYGRDFEDTKSVERYLVLGHLTVSYTHLTLPTNREV